MLSSHTEDIYMCFLLTSDDRVSLQLDRYLVTNQTTIEVTFGKPSNYAINFM